MSKSLHKFTTQYIDIEDRIRVSGVTIEGDTLSLWLTHRLLTQLVPTLCHCIERHSSIGQLQPDSPTPPARLALQQQVIQEFEQQAASSNIKPANRVQTSAESPMLLIDEATVELTPSGVNIQLGCSPKNQIVCIAFQPDTLRQWIGILFNAYSQSRWTKDIWPNWLKSPVTYSNQADEVEGTQQPGPNLFH
jgi:hypothetical protein